MQHALTARITVPQADVSLLEAAVQRASGDVDMLLTCEWPAHVSDAVPPGSASACPAGGVHPFVPPRIVVACSLLAGTPSMQLHRGRCLCWTMLTAACCSAGSQVIAEVATRVRPRYHVAGGHEAVFYARPPYLNKDLGAGETLPAVWICRHLERGRSHGVCCSERMLVCC